MDKKGVAKMFVFVLAGVLLLVLPFFVGKDFVIRNESDSGQGYFVVNGSSGDVGISGDLGLGGVGSERIEEIENKIFDFVVTGNGCQVSGGVLCSSCARLGEWGVVYGK